MMFIRKPMQNKEDVRMEDQKLTKEQEKELQRQIKKVNAAYSTVSSRTTKTTGIQTVRANENVIFRGNETYLRVYSVKPGVLSDEKRRELIDCIATKQKCRIRITCVNKVLEAGQRGQFMFLTVTAVEQDFYNAQFLFNETNDALLELGMKLSIEIKLCTIEEILSYGRYNFSQDQKMMEWKDVVSGDWNSLLFDKKEAVENRAALIGHDYPGEVKCVRDYLIQQADEVMVIADILPLTEEWKKEYNDYLKSIYTHDIEDEERIFCNVTYGVMFSVNDSLIKENIIHDLYKYNVILFDEEDSEYIYKSGCSLGILDYHKMKMIDSKTITNLIL